MKIKMPTLPCEAQLHAWRFVSFLLNCRSTACVFESLVMFESFESQFLLHFIDKYLDVGHSYKSLEFSFIFLFYFSFDFLILF